MDALTSGLRADLVSLVNVLFGVTAPNAQPGSTTAERPEPAVAQQAPSAIEMPSIELASTPAPTAQAAAAAMTEQPAAPAALALPEATVAPVAIPVPALAVPHWEDSPAETEATPIPVSIPVPGLAVEQPKVSTKRSMALLNEIGFLDD